MPRSFSETYDHIFFKVTERHPTYAMRILQWLTFSARPLSAAQVAEVVAIDAARDPAFDYDEVMENPLEPLNICSTFVTISDPAVEPRMITLAHPSIRDYLYDKLRGNTCHDTMAKGCLKYLLQLPETSSYEVVQTFKLARYCAEFWMYHAREAEEHMDSTSQMAIQLFSIENPAYLTWIRLYDPDMPEMEPDFSKTMDQVATPLYYAALLGLSNVVELLLGKGADINTTGGRHGNAVQAAMAEGHESVVKLLLDKGADVDAHSER
ncbi:hypothetical protein SLS60_002850 [Paraconiothyrium brasiliense]|uniref:Ankyrin repeat protein n=1 Tax=Paraconiothyrium brasiliense TaxID=300254 RepID=A0ABR3RU00_9PLEO